jgi:hypothetical protein
MDRLHGTLRLNRAGRQPQKPNGQCGPAGQTPYPGTDHLTHGLFLVVCQIPATEVLYGLQGWPVAIRFRRGLAESPLSCGMSHQPAYMLRKPCQERGRIARVTRKTAAKSTLPSFTRETPYNLLRTATRRIASGAELWFEKL